MVDNTHNCYNLSQMLFVKPWKEKNSLTCKIVGSNDLQLFAVKERFCWHCIMHGIRSLNWNFCIFLEMGHAFMYAHHLVANVIEGVCLVGWTRLCD